ncbi:MAG: zinc metallopeptidase [Bacteroidales bacterium]|nr:zinc metallopeptidase [Bacteroidales bacterium]
MKLTGRRQSTNVEDRRGKGGKILGFGIGGALIIGIITFALNKFGINVDESQLQQVGQNFGINTEQTSEYTPTEKEKEFEVFAKQILASTEDVWKAQFKKMGKTYKNPTMVLFKGSVQSGCGSATSAVGPFYCSADEKLYLDLDFFDELSTKFGASGDFACAYVIAHEVGHHVQHLLGTLDNAHAKMAKQNEVEKNKTSVRIELQADYYSGIWGYYEKEMFGSIEAGDFEEAINAAQKIGDDYLQKRSRGDVTPENFTHGTSAQRMKWLKKGLSTGDMSGGDTWSCNYNAL